MIYLWAIGGYLLFLIGVGLYRSRQVRTQEDFMVAGRKVSALFLVGTLVCTWIGSGSLFGGAGRAFRHGFSALWMSAGAWVGIAIVYFLAGRVRKIAEFTVPDILERRYNSLARLLGSLTIIIAYLTIASYQMIGGGRLLNILTGIDPVIGQLIVAVLVVIYTILAGMLSIVALDMFNGILILAGVFLAVPFLLSQNGGLQGLVAHLPAEHFTLFGSVGLLPSLGLFFPTFFLLLGESSMYQKFFSAKDAKSARRAVMGMIIGVILIETVLAFDAILGAGLYFKDPSFVNLDGSFNKSATETIILQVARYNLPLITGILLLIGATAIIFSTANTFLMIPSTNLTRDIYQRFLNPEASDRQVIVFQRVMIVLLAAIAFIVSSFFESILDMALYAYTMVGAGLTPALLACFLWKRVTPQGGVASITTGMVITIIFGVLNSAGITSWDYDYIIYPAGIGSILALIIVSLATRPSPEEVWKPFMGS